MIYLTVLTLLLAALGAAASDEASDSYYTYFTLKNNGYVSCSGDYINSASLELECDEAYCPLGTTITLTGDVTVGSNGLPSESASIDLTVSGFSVYTWDNVNLCESLEGGGCPNQGTYSVPDYSLDLPDPSSSLNLAGSMGMTVSVTTDISFDSGESEKCTFEIALVNRNTGYSMGYIGMAGFMIFGVATTLGIKRRQVATIQLQDEDTEGAHNNFELMPQERGGQV